MAHTTDTLAAEYWATGTLAGTPAAGTAGVPGSPSRSSPPLPGLLASAPGLVEPQGRWRPRRMPTGRRAEGPYVAGRPAS